MCADFPPIFGRQDEQSEQPIGGKFWEGATHIARSPYLLGLAVFLMIYTLTNTWAYFQQADLTQHQLQDRAVRTSFLANIDIAVNTITVLIQVFLTGRLMKWFGVGITLVLMPLLSAVGFAAIGFAPILTVLATFQILRRAAGFALLRPAREVLFTVLRREDKYKAKSLIDTFGYRFGDQIGAWSYPLMRWFGLGLVGISWVAVPIGAIWCGLSIWLGRKQRQLAEVKRDQAAVARHGCARSGLSLAVECCQIEINCAWPRLARIVIKQSTKGDKTMATRTGSAVWEGTLKEGKGTMKLGSGAFEGPYSFSSRFEEGKGTNPEELIGAAEAGCYSMALSANLEKAGHPAKRVSTTATVKLEMVGGGPKITTIDLKD